MIYALIVNNTVINVISADAAFVQNLIDLQEIDNAVLISEGDHRPSPGDSYIDGVFSSAEVPNVLTRQYQCLSCGMLTAHDSDVLQHARDHSGHVFVRVFY